MKSDSSPQNQEILKVLNDLASRKVAYPPELLAARRAAFLDQVEQRSQVEFNEALAPKEQEIVQLLQSLKSVDGEYSSKLLSARRSDFRNQIAHINRVSFWQKLRSAIQNAFANLPTAPRTSSPDILRTSFVLVSLTMAAVVGFLFYGNRGELATPTSSPNGISQPGAVFATRTPEAKTICKPGFVPPLCLAKAFDKNQDLTYPGNGSARPAVAKDTSHGDGGIHQPGFVNDGLYGPGASWVSNSPNSWIKIDLGKATTINTVTFGRHRLGQINDRDPGQFVIAVALSDDVYADGNSNNDNREYTPVFNSDQAGFKGTISGAETVTVQFNSLMARYVKITFEKAGTAIDEVEVFNMKTIVPTKDRSNGNKGSSNITPPPTNRPLPTDTLTPLPTDTPIPTDTPVPPTDTPIPTDTPVPPADTPIPTDTTVSVDTGTPLPFSINAPLPTATPIVFLLEDAMHPASL